MELNNGINRTYGKITVDAVNASQFKDGVMQAQLRQVITTTYPSKRAGNSLSDSLGFTQDDFNFGDGQSFDSTRITWIDVPEGTTIQKVKELLKAKPQACIQRIISNNVEDVLTAEQKSAISRGLRTLDQYKESLVVKKQDGSALKGAPQYRQHFFKAVATEDKDLRKNVAAPANAEVGMLNA